MAKNIIISGTGFYGATIKVQYKIVGDPSYTTVTFPSEDLPYTILNLDDAEDYEVIVTQICVSPK